MNHNYILIGGTHDGRCVHIPEEWENSILSKSMRLKVPVRMEDVMKSMLYDCEVYLKVRINQDYAVYVEKNLTFDDVMMLLIKNYRPLAHRT